ncbi:DUF3995 domain-containing protein [Kitasatospora sp. NPDC059747]|uniref:DUF3995 domain-containing protein n=1 Tax=Kitasatospora sp. NPDC059747 TaxID=3346930 RepID=UPI003668B85C
MAARFERRGVAVVPSVVPSEGTTPQRRCCFSLLVHLYWASGRTWPVHGTVRLSQLVLNTRVPFTPQGLIPLAGMLFSGAALVLVRGGRLPALGRRLPAVLPRWGSRAVAAGLLARGAVGLVWVTGAWADPADTFYWLNLLLYTPLCLLLGRAAWQVSAAEGVSALPWRVVA